MSDTAPVHGRRASIVQAVGELMAKEYSGECTSGGAPSVPTAKPMANVDIAMCCRVIVGRENSKIWRTVAVDALADHGQLEVLMGLLASAFADTLANTVEDALALHIACACARIMLARTAATHRFERFEDFAVIARRVPAAQTRALLAHLHMDDELLWIAGGGIPALAEPATCRAAAEHIVGEHYLARLAYHAGADVVVRRRAIERMRDARELEALVTAFQERVATVGSAQHVERQLHAFARAQLLRACCASASEHPQEEGSHG